ncbi:MAG: hypothetical protein HYZ79_04735, partial [Candidatus Melainabacteria bacterium]|nr:hypothetical protein [Candidatus Melainabacteria bacterium]
VIDELKQNVQGFEEELAKAIEQIKKKEKKNAILNMSISQKRALIKKVISKLKEANEQIENLKSHSAKRQAARLILTCAGLAAPHFHLLGLSVDLCQAIGGSSKYVDLALLPLAARELVPSN